jgi:hypothetical protein
VTSLPSGTTFSAALTKLQDHDLLIRLDPELAHYEQLPAQAPNTHRFKVMDHMHALPKGLWDTTVSYESEITNSADGVEWVIKAPLGLVQRTTWRILKSNEVDVGKGKEKVMDMETEQGEDEEHWSLVEDVEIKASRFLVGTVKAKCEQNWRGVHATFIGQLKD